LYRDIKYNKADGGLIQPRVKVCVPVLAKQTNIYLMLAPLRIAQIR
jgi:hypothetical protein